MHIPDGYLGPQTYVPAYGVMLPLWAWASRRLKTALRARQVPLLALGAAFSFVIMMFNVPVPGGVTGHAAGSVLVAILLGPWAAVVAVSVALVVQALMFGDGGITALGANCLNLAVIMPFTGWWAYRLIAARAPALSRVHWIGAAVGGYVGLNAAALATGLMLGLQPLIARDAAGRALYSPFSLKTAVTAMSLSHLLAFGFVEALVTGLVVGYLQRTDPKLIAGGARPVPRVQVPPRPVLPRLVLGLGLLVLLAPLGLYLPAWMGAGSAWGEWSAEEVSKLAGYVPSGLARLGDTWRAPLPDYAPTAGGAAALPVASLWYIASGVVGVGLIALLVLGLRRWLSAEGRG